MGEQTSEGAVDVLLAAAAEAASVCNHIADYPLHRAIRNKAGEDVLIAILTAAPAIAATKDRNLLCPLLRLVSNAQEGISSAFVQALLAAAPHTAAPARSGFMPLHMAMKRGATAEVVLALLAAAPEAAAVQDYEGCTPLHHVKQQTPLEVVQALIAAGPAGEGVRNLCSAYPLHSAILAKASEEVLCAIHAAAPEVAREMHHSDFPLLMLFENYWNEVPVRLLDVAPEAAAAAGRLGRLPLHAAMITGAHLEVVRALLEAAPETAAARPCPSSTTTVLWKQSMH